MGRGACLVVVNGTEKGRRRQGLGEADNLGSNPASDYQLCDPEQVTCPVCALVSSSVKWG